MTISNIVKLGYMILLSFQKAGADDKGPPSRTSLADLRSWLFSFTEHAFFTLKFESVAGLFCVRSHFSITIQIPFPVFTALVSLRQNAQDSELIMKAWMMACSHSKKMLFTRFIVYRYPISVLYCLHKNKVTKFLKIEVKSYI